MPAEKLVLIVEDDRFIRILSADLLLEGGMGILEAADGEEALAILEQRAPDVGALVTDIKMPGSCDGLRPCAARGDAMAVDFYSGHVGQFQRAPAGPSRAGAIHAEAMARGSHARFRACSRAHEFSLRDRADRSPLSLRGAIGRATSAPVVSSDARPKAGLWRRGNPAMEHGNGWIA
jgi:DNA-binding NtrC family response regulator